MLAGTPTIKFTPSVSWPWNRQLTGTKARTRAGLFEAILPQDNQKDVAEVPENLRSAMKLHFVDTVDQVLAIALERPLPDMTPVEAEGAITLPIAEPPAAHQ